MTYMGVGAPYITATVKQGRRPGEELDLSALRGIGSTGSPLPPEGFAWVYEAVGKDLLLGSFSGGTDICTGFVGPCTLLPLRAGVIQCRGLGAKVEAFGEDGRPVLDEVGELVLTEPMPSMPVFFWNDENGDRYRDSYFGMYQGVWRHGDWIKILPDGGCVIYGRSDSTLNRGGVRMGTSDFYRVVEAFDEITDSLVIDTGRPARRAAAPLRPARGGRVPQRRPAGEPAAGDPVVAVAAARAGRDHRRPRHPRTLSGKKLEVPVRKILQGTPVDQAANRDSMANPEVLTHFTP